MTSDARATLNRAMTEDELLTAVTEALELYGYVWTHSRRSDKALTMGHQGVPDIIAARRGRVVFLELKRQKGATTIAQRRWLHELPDRDDAMAAVVRPSNLDEILRWLA